MEKSKYYALLSGKEKPRFVEVNGRKAIIPGFEDFDFFCYTTDCMSFVVVEAQTGMAAGVSGNSSKAARTKAIKNLIRQGKDKFKEIIEQMVKENGLSPRYGGENGIS